ncbi:MAG: hypothetical protein Q7J16_05575 [Candidatus Cloacimonadales bacterium]|nr:hypothetical protein [Candidatus Cloacimonadales bacterium]
MKKLTIFIIVVFSILNSCSINKQEAKFFPLWWQQQDKESISSFGQGINADEKTARFAAQNDAYKKISGQAAYYLNQHVAENCIAPGDKQIQNELDNIFRHFMNYFNNIEKPEITIGESEFVRVTIDRKNKIEYFIRLYVESKYVHSKFVEFLDTTDRYMNPKLRAVLKECFEE